MEQCLMSNKTMEHVRNKPNHYCHPDVASYGIDVSGRQDHGARQRNAIEGFIETSINGSPHEQYERNLNMTTGSNVDDSDYGFPKKKTVRDPLSHRIIEKRRRDRMNNCLADLARLLPPSSLRKGRGRIEKTEIVELAIKHLRHLQCHPCPSGENCEFNYIAKSGGLDGDACDATSYHSYSLGSAICMNFTSSELSSEVRTMPLSSSASSSSPSTPEDHFRQGFQECLNEVTHYLKEEESIYPGDSFTARVQKHLIIHSENIIKEHFDREGRMRLLNSAAPTIIKQETGEEIRDAPPAKFIQGINEGRSSFSGFLANGPSSSSSSSSSGSESHNESGPGAQHVNRLNNTCDKDTSARSMNTSRSVCSPSSSSSFSSTCPSLIISESPSDGQESSVTSGSNHRYKFKSNIKQRFVANLIDPASGNENEGKDENESRKSQAEQHIVSHSPRRESSEKKGQGPCSPSDPTDSSSSVRSSNNRSKGSQESLLGDDKVPAFALHESGLFYIPLTIDKFTLTSQSPKLDVRGKVPPLHPVTISVCFAPKEGSPNSLSPNNKFNSDTLLVPNPTPRRNSNPPCPTVKNSTLSITPTTNGQIPSPSLQSSKLQQISPNLYSAIRGSSIPVPLRNGDSSRASSPEDNIPSNVRHKDSSDFVNQPGCHQVYPYYRYHPEQCHQIVGIVPPHHPILGDDENGSTGVDRKQGRKRAMTLSPRPGYHYPQENSTFPQIVNEPAAAMALSPRHRQNAIDLPKYNHPNLQERLLYENLLKINLFQDSFDRNVRRIYQNGVEGAYISDSPGTVKKLKRGTNS